VNRPKLIHSLRWRKLHAAWRDTWLLFREFRWPLLAFCAAVGGGGGLYHALSRQAGEPVGNLVEALYHVLGMTFLQPAAAFPKTWYLELFYFLMPIIGIGILAQGVADFGVNLFNRRTRSREWEKAVASTFSSHLILVGLGHLGFRVVQNLQQMEQEVVVIERNPKADLVATVRGWGIPVIEEDAAREATLEAASIRKARAIVLCTQNDSLNLQVALKARSLNKTIQIVVRIFDDEFAQSLHDQFGFTAMSATGMAAPAFAAAAAGVDITRPIVVEGQSFSLARLNVAPRSPLSELTIGQVEAQYNLSVVLLRRKGDTDAHPTPQRSLEAGDVLAVLGGPAEISLLLNENTSQG
jgi:Trk K+ transport system NAD-binding subunit